MTMVAVYRFVLDGCLILDYHSVDLDLPLYNIMELLKCIFILFNILSSFPPVFSTFFFYFFIDPTLETQKELLNEITLLKCIVKIIKSQ